MNHLAIIQCEFLKESRKWDELPLDEQRLYLRRHPKSKRRLTAIDGSDVEQKEDKGSYKITNSSVREVDARNSEYDVNIVINGKEYKAATVNMFNGRDKDVISTKWNQDFLSEFFPKEKKVQDFSYSSGMYNFPPHADDMLKSMLENSGYKLQK
jgi:hypothetical protein